MILTRSHCSGRVNGLGTEIIRSPELGLEPFIDLHDHLPVAVSCDLLGGGAGLELLIGYTRLGNLLALLDREEVPEVQKHLVWVGRAAN